MNQAETETHQGPPHVHHMDSDTAYASAKLGMWLFLATEILLFGGLFTGFAIYRYLYLDAFAEASTHLNWGMGAVNTVVLIFSSLTAALAVSAAQKGNNAAVRKYIYATIACGFGFLVIKYFEYKSKAQHGLFPGETSAFALVMFLGAIFLFGSYFLVGFFADPKGKGFTRNNLIRLAVAVVACAVIYFAGSWLAGVHFDLAKLLPFGPEASHAKEHYNFNDANFSHEFKSFFGLYYCMTGLHALHVLIGMLILYWALIKAKVNRFSKDYYTPVEVAALYWHLVDLIWIYLFPLLYLVG